MRVLLVEDNETNAYMMTYLLESEGNDVEVAATLAEALSRADGGGHDIILLDIRLPDGEGLDVVRALRRRTPPSAVPVIAVSSHAMTGDRAAALAAGCDEYIEKPINPDSFLAAVRRFAPEPAPIP